jgi:ribosomal protein L37AE/L43A
MSGLRSMRRAITKPVRDMTSPRCHRQPMQAKLAGYNIWICFVCGRERPMDPIAIALMSPAPEPD